MTTELKDLNVDALKDLGRVQKLEGHNDMTRDELLEALDGPVDDALAKWLGKPRSEIYEAAGEAGIEDRKDKQKWELLEALAKKG
ncbi:hypothetical protein [Jannaschia ovalis]|uniref:Uncharacterized protein n=1 Tax=Jannaschia ovalis TaxID=3038773 RepID=A0ABY8LBI0_9RHOB|nr:hypothetical protein [Jannaschia sp. GRR-S6-38]WGH77405.1 hypothetical protein P8627_10130 [Jannaschia sp. GRR-S6-38]